jgi:hypothetical protein
MENDLLAIEKYPSQDLINWIKTEDKKNKKNNNGKIAKTISKIGIKRTNGINRRTRRKR